jgi:hypothetical protein
VHKTEDNDNGFYGFVATMDVYGYNLNGGQLSSAAIWVNNTEGDWKQDLDAITVGWVVSFRCSHVSFYLNSLLSCFSCIILPTLACGPVVTPPSEVAPA